MKALNKITDRLSDNKNVRITFAKLDMSSIRMVRINNAAFVNSRGSRSQLGYIVLILDKHGTTNIIH